MQKNYLNLLVAGFSTEHQAILTRLLTQINESDLGIELSFQTATGTEDITCALNETFFKVCLIDPSVSQNINAKFIEEIQTKLQIQNKATAIISIQTQCCEEAVLNSNIVPLHSARSVLPPVDIHQLNCFWLSFIIKAAYEKIQLQKDIKRLTHYDNLTGLVNRNLYLNHLNHALGLAEREKRFCTLIYLDINNFKQLNDQYSHKIGDDILIESAQRIKKTIRSVDIAARLGSDEFAVLLENCSPQEANRIILDLKQAMALPYVINNEKLNVHFSIDNASYPDLLSDKTSFLNNVRQAHYMAKSP